MRMLLLWLAGACCCAAADNSATNAGTSGFAEPPPAETVTSAPIAAPKPAASSAPKPGARHGAAGSQTAAQMQAALDQLAQSNHDLMDLLHEQQAVLKDMQVDYRQQNRQLQSMEERLEETLGEKHLLENKVAKLESEAAVRPAGAPSAFVEPAVTRVPESAPSAREPVSLSAPAPRAMDRNLPAPADPPPPATYLPPATSDAVAGVPSWHRLFALKGDDSKQTEPFTIQGKTWRVFWHNQDKTGKMYANTSALFINAFPKDDTIPQKVSSKLGSGGDSTVLQGAGTYYLKIDASGGNWEVAVEDFH